MHDVVNILHDSIDAAEDLELKAREIVRTVWTERLRQLMDEARDQGEGDKPSTDIELGLELIAAEVGLELDSLTSNAIRTGYQLGKRIVASK